MKKLLNKILPKFIITILVKQKYKKYNQNIHKQNIKDNKIVNIDCTNNEKYNFLKKTLYKSFGGIIKVQEFHFYFYPVAIIEIPKNIDQYLKSIGAKSRNMNKKAEKNGISCRIFDWNSKLDDIYEINTSSLIRQGREMDKSYQQYPIKTVYPDEKDFSIVHIGAFIEDKLIGYIELYIYGNFAMTNRILGHKEYLRYGVMNLMIKECVDYGIKNNFEYLNYLAMPNRKNNSLLHNLLKR